MNRIRSARSALAALAGLTVVWTGCASPAWPDGGTFDPQACAEDALRRNRDPALAREAVAYSVERCRAGGTDGCSMLGVAYELGLGVRQDRALARSIYQHTCDAGDVRACGNLGELLLSGGESPSGAIALLRKACEAGHARPCGVLGDAYASGASIPRAPAEAVSWSERACARGDAPSCVRLVDLGASAARTDKLLTLACVGGDVEGCDRLGRRARSQPGGGLAAGPHGR